MRAIKYKLLLFLTIFLVILCLYYLYYEEYKDGFNNSDQFNSLERRIDVIEELLMGDIKRTKNLFKRIESIKYDLNGNKKKVLDQSEIIPVLVIACDRVTVTRCLDSLLQYRNDSRKFPIIVSQDCRHKPTYEAIKEYVDRYPDMTLIEQSNVTIIQPSKRNAKFRGYYYISRHYKFALEYVFNMYDQAIIVEDDLEISIDFYEYFEATLTLLRTDPTLWCISAWNDNGKEGLIDMGKPNKLYRTDFFPGLGWMLIKPVATELLSKWPKAFWDDWMRDPEQHKGRACIRPEISRTRTFGRVGVSNGLFFDKHLKFIILNKQYVPFTKHNLQYLTKEKYDTNYDLEVFNVPGTSSRSSKDLMQAKLSNRTVRLIYHNADNYKLVASTFGLMDDTRAHIPRTAYRGVVQCYQNKRLVYLSRTKPVEGDYSVW